MKFLNKCREPEKIGTTGHKVLMSCMILLLGGVLGALSKWLDTLPVNELPRFMRSWDLANVLGQVPIWALIALAVAVFSKSALRGAINAMCFFAGVVVSYSLCSLWNAGFMLDRSYLTVWIVLTLAAFPLGFIVWYARGKGAPAVIVSALIIAYFILQAFSFDAGLSYFGLACGAWGVVFLVLAVLIVFVDPMQTLIALGAALPLAYLIRLSGLSIPYVL